MCPGEVRTPERGRTQMETAAPAPGEIPLQAHGGWGREEVAIHLFLKSLILKSKAERTHLLRGVKVFYPCLLPSWREFRAILVPLPPPSSLKHYFKVDEKKKKVFQMLSFLPHPQKPKGCGKRQDPMLLAFEWKPTNCSFWLCPLEHAIFWTGLDLWEQRSTGTKTEVPRNPCSSHHHRLPAAPALLTEADKGSDS